uniref:Head completion nuclease n=2 Tax=unclassified Caudoviricetes TaxID=2788787 RepID=A0AAU8HXS6_9CAUD
MAHTKTLKSKFEPKNLAKYMGDSTNIITRSSWEYFFASWCDNSPIVERWASEEVVVQYISPKDGREHRYFIDFFVIFKDGKKVLFEIKPHAQTLPPVWNGKKTRKAETRYMEDMVTYQINQAKWAYARRFAERNGLHFEVFTEHHLRKLGMPI